MKSLLSHIGGVLCCTAVLLCGPQVLADGHNTAEEIHSSANPILGDGRSYSADPAPLVADDMLYILAGRDEAPEGVNDFIIREWQLFATKNVSSGHWQHYPHFLKPRQVFKWATDGRAYAGQIIRGRNGKYYLYAPVMQANCKDPDCFGIGVAVSDKVLGPWRDAHPKGPILSQSAPEANDIQNIDPTPFVDSDGRVYIYWGTFGHLRAVELKSDMVTPKGRETEISGLPGFFEAPWLFKRKDTYYLAYAANNAGPKSDCTPTLYHACIAYASAPGPMGPWTYRGVILPPVSSTTSHPGIIKFHDQWYIVYHTADAKKGGDFRRSVAIDKLEWNDSVSPAAIRPVTPTPEPPAVIGPQRNVAPGAKRYVSNTPVPVQFWDHAINDGIVRQNPLPPDMWSTWDGENTPEKSWIAYLWHQPQTLNAVRMYFWSDHPAGSSIGVAPPASWHLEYCQGKNWKPLQVKGGYPTTSGKFVTVHFAPIQTRCLRAMFDASGQAGKNAAVAVEEWQALAVKPVKVVVVRN